MLELIIFEIVDHLERSSRYSHWIIFSLRNAFYGYRSDAILPLLFRFLKYTADSRSLAFPSVFRSVAVLHCGFLENR